LSTTLWNDIYKVLKARSTCCYAQILEEQLDCIILLATFCHKHIIKQNKNSEKHKSNISTKVNMHTWHLHRHRRSQDSAPTAPPLATPMSTGNIKHRLHISPRYTYNVELLWQHILTFLWLSLPNATAKPKQMHNNLVRRTPPFNWCFLLSTYTYTSSATKSFDILGALQIWLLLLLL